MVTVSDKSVGVTCVVNRYANLNAIRILIDESRVSSAAIYFFKSRLLFQYE